MNIQQALVAAYNSRDDVAFDRLTEQVMKRVTDLEQKLLTAAGDDLCRLSQEEIKELSLGKVQIPPKEEFLSSCGRFWMQVAGEAGVNNNCLTLAQLIAENERLAQRLREIDAGAKADADDLEKMRDGTKLTRSGLVEIIVYQQQDLAAAKHQVDRLWEADKVAHPLNNWQLVVLSKLRELLRFAIPSQSTPAKQESVQEK